MASSLFVFYMARVKSKAFAIEPRHSPAIESLSTAHADTFNWATVGNPGNALDPRLDRGRDLLVLEDRGLGCLDVWRTIGDVAFTAVRKLESIDFQALDRATGRPLGRVKTTLGRFQQAGRWKISGRNSDRGHPGTEIPESLAWHFLPVSEQQLVR